MPDRCFVYLHNFTIFDRPETLSKAISLFGSHFFQILIQKMKFLCLHGMGTNSSIFESQLSSTLPYLEAQGHEFIFVDGLIECAPAKGKLCRKLILKVAFA